jgi:hypothetical protein
MAISNAAAYTEREKDRKEEEESQEMGSKQATITGKV